MKPLLFVHVPKCGGTSILTQREIELANDAGSPSHQLISEMPLAKHFKTFTFVRSPYTKIYSAYSFCKRNESRAKTMGIENLTFEEFILSLPAKIESRLFIPQWDFVTINGDYAVDLTGKFETLQEDWELISGATMKLPRENTGDGQRWAVWTDEMKDIVYDRYKVDFKMFDYDK